MSRVRVLVGTRKGAFVLEADGQRKKWNVSGPHFAGWEIYHVKGSPADPERLFASQTSGWFGQIIQRSDDGGKSWHQPGTPPGEPTKTPDGMPKGESNKFAYDASPETGKPLTTHQWYDGSQRPWEFKRVWHLEPSLTDPDRLFASQTSGWFGQIIQRSDDGGKTWHQPGTPPGEPAKTPDGMPKGESNKFAYDASPETGKPLTTHQWYDGSQRPWEFKRVWHVEPSRTDPDTAYAGVEDAALFRTTDGGQNWKELSGLRGHGTGPQWQPGAGGLCLHTIIEDPKDPRRLFVAISSAGAFRTDDGGTTWKPINRGLRSSYIPDPDAEIGHCVHRIALHPSRPNVLFMQKHWDVLRSDDAGDSWREVSGNLPSDFGFVIDVNANEPETIYVVPIKSDSEHFVPDGKLRVYRSRSGGNEWEALTNGLPQSDCYVNVLRDAMAVDSLDKCGVYFGTTGGQVYASADAGDNWAPIVRDLPPVLSVEVQTLR